MKKWKIILCDAPDTMAQHWRNSSAYYGLPGEYLWATREMGTWRIVTNVPERTIRAMARDAGVRRVRVYGSEKTLEDLGEEMPEGVRPAFYAGA